MRGGAAEHRALCWGDVRLGFDKELDKHYLEYNERQTKTRTGAEYFYVQKQTQNVRNAGDSRADVP